MKNKVVRIISICLAGCILLAATIAFLLVLAVTRDPEYVPFDREKVRSVAGNLKVLDVYGNVIAEPFYFGKYKQIPLSCLSEHTKNAFIAVEDKRFYSHGGVDVKRIFGALLSDLKSGSFKEGASTISQQLIKNTHLTNDKSLKRKVNEILLALKMEKNFSKDEILEAYLNTIYFGKNAYGIESASNLYFDKSASELTLSESAMLAALVKAPNVYSPFANPEKCAERRQLVLELMQKNGFISQEEMENAAKKDLPSAQRKGANEIGYVYKVMQQAEKLLNMTQAQLMNSDLVIKTYYDPQCQKNLENAVKSDKTTTVSGKKASVTAMITRPYDCGVAAYFEKRGEKFAERRAVGSAIKPLAVYAPAINERKITQATPVLDERTNFAGYCPANFGDKYFGWTDVRTAVEKSLNVPAVKVLNSVGVDKASEYLGKLGLSGAANKQNLSLALGNIEGGTTIEELAGAYTALSSGGIAKELSFISKIENQKGTVYENKCKGVKVFSTETAFLVTDMLRNVATKGTASKLSDLEIDVACKTGTVGDEKGNTDAIICGYTTDAVFAVRICSDESMDCSVTGGGAPAEIAKKWLKSQYENAQPKEFAVPDGVIRLYIDKAALDEAQLVLLTDNNVKTSQKAAYYFDINNQPKKYSRQNDKISDIEVAIDVNCCKIAIPKCDCTVVLHKLNGERHEEIAVESGKIYCDREVVAGETYRYYAEFFRGGKKIKVSNMHEITLPMKLPRKSITDFWYFP